MRLARRLWRTYGAYALGFASLFAFWQLASLYLVSSVLFPPPTVVFAKGLLLARNGVLLEHLAASLKRILAGFVAGSLLGVPIGTPRSEPATNPARMRLRLAARCSSSTPFLASKSPLAKTTVGGGNSTE